MTSCAQGGVKNNVIKKQNEAQIDPALALGLKAASFEWGKRRGGRSSSENPPWGKTLQTQLVTSTDATIN